MDYGNSHDKDKQNRFSSHNLKQVQIHGVCKRYGRHGESHQHHGRLQTAEPPIWRIYDTSSN